MFETTEEGGNWSATGTIYVVATIRRDTLGFVGYLPNVFLTQEDADECLDAIDADPTLAYIVQEKEFSTELMKGGQP
jgi:hypothetical protein